jgi:flagellar biosynthesis/type III secretory pathway protein FliH
MASVIKAGKVIRSGTPVQHSDFNLEDMSNNASRYLDTVRQQAAQILTQARQQAQETSAQAEQQGKQAAVEAATSSALAEVEARWQTLAPALQSAVEATSQLRHTWVRDWEENLLRLVVAVAERVVRGELTRRPEISHQWIRESLEMAAGGQRIKLLLNPDDYEALGEHRTTVADRFGDLSPTEIVPDPKITPGGCRVVTEHGHIDQQLEKQLARIEEELRG